MINSENEGEVRLTSLSASIRHEQASSSSMDSQSTSETFDNSTIEVSDQPLLNSPIGYSMNQIEILQNLESYTFAAQFEADDFLQKKIALWKKPKRL